MKSQPVKSKRSKVAYIEVECASNQLTMETIGEENLRKIEQEQYHLKWKRDGQVRTVPRFIVEDVIRCYREGQRGLAGSTLADHMPKVHAFSWAQAGLTEAEMNPQPHGI